AVTAADGDQALRALATEGADAVILDVMMPGESGYQVCRRIRQRDRHFGRHTPVVLLTARDLSDDPERETMILASCGADAMLYKPIDLEVLVDRVRGLLPVAREEEHETTLFLLPPDEDASAAFAAASED
ncbi:MAG: response regulator, partial [Thermoanaerobaculia bacterium]|nr:response regulator [Thermoanaerobaculia bacterium]